MRRIRFTEEPIIAVLQEHEAGSKTEHLARKYAVSPLVARLHPRSACSWPTLQVLDIVVT